MSGEDLFVDQLIRDDGLTKMERDQFDELPFGTVKLDPAGCVVLYNAFEAALARRDAADMIGRSFFEEVAPCTNNTIFRGGLDRLVARGGKNARFDYKFRFRWGDRAVRIQFWVPNPRERWIFVLPKELDTAI